MQNVEIGIQIRNSSSRLPNKSKEVIGDKYIWQHVVDSVSSAVAQLNKYQAKSGFKVGAHLLVPDLELEFWQNAISLYKCEIETVIGGDMNNVFSRYEKLVEQTKPNYLMRITGDCPFLPSQLIIKAINSAVTHRIDYCSNTDPMFRTMPDGYDVEVISGVAFEWMQNHIDDIGDESDYEHVTTLLKKEKPSWLRIGVLTSTLDLSDLKYSIDTKEDLELVKNLYERKLKKDITAKKRGYGIYAY